MEDIVPVNNRALNELREHIAEDGKVYLFQKRPYTFVMVEWTDPGGRIHSVCGFAKVMKPDVWSARRGFEVALGKATKEMALTYVEGEITSEKPLLAHMDAIAKMPYSRKHFLIVPPGFASRTAI